MEALQILEKIADQLKEDGIVCTETTLKVKPEWFAKVKQEVKTLKSDLKVMVDRIEVRYCGRRFIIIKSDINSAMFETFIPDLTKNISQ